MNWLTQCETPQELGEGGMAEINQLHRWLSDGQPAPWKARYAPSVVVRSEIELFGISAPRFSIRVYLSEDGKSFVNVRRLAALLQIDRRLGDGTRRAASYSRHHSRTDRVATGKASVGCSWIADGFLQAPPRLSEFRILRTTLGVAYGETAGPDFSGTPFMRPIGGGLCAQAACFMATTLLHEYAGEIYGLWEITRRATQQPYKEISITGLTTKEMASYFSAAHLNAIWQEVTMRHLADAAGLCLFGTALQAYVHSGMPIVFPVDNRRMAGNFSGILGFEATKSTPLVSIYDRNGLRTKAHVAGDEDYPHVVLVIGAREDSFEFLINDPLSMPFMRVSASDLATASMYYGGKRGAEESLFVRGIDRPIPGQGGHQARDGLLFLPVTPKEVQLPLLRWRDPAQSHSACKGLLDYAKYYQNGSRGIMLPRVSKELQPGYLRLAQMKDLTTLPLPSSKQMVSQQWHLEALKCGVSSVSQHLERGGNHWVWIQLFEDSFWICDAEISLPEHAEVSLTANILLMVVARQSASGPILFVGSGNKFVKVAVSKGTT